MYEIRNIKNRIRAEYRAARRAIPAAKRAEADEALCRFFLNSASYRYYDTLLLYCATPEEADLSGIARQALADGKRVAYPRCEPKTRKMCYYRVASLDELVRGSFGLREPPETAEKITPEEADRCVCLIPAVVFDRRGYRVGYGMGYYDRFLSVFRCARVGVAYSEFILKSVPHGKFDVRADVLLTQGGFVSVEKN